MSNVIERLLTLHWLESTSNAKIQSEELSSEFRKQIQ
jgi:hypothetical protein